jgi:hypothetical protein
MKGVTNVMFRLKVAVKFMLIAGLSMALIGSFVALLSMRSAIAASDEELARIGQEIIEQLLRNDEYNDILADANTEDFYKNDAENELGYASRNEKIYIDISGH